ncbi:LPXTG cell wall anchor domain-containing protein [Paenibacillus sp. 1001270B_150601_E10]
MRRLCLSLKIRGQELPQTGERPRHGQTLFGLLSILCAIYLFTRKNKLKK